MYVNYQIFVETTSDCVNDRHFMGREVVSLSHKRFSIFYVLSPEKWKLSKCACIYAPDSNKGFAILFSFKDYLKYVHRELKQQQKTQQSLENTEREEADIKTLKRFAEYIKEDLAVFEQSNPMLYKSPEVYKDDS